MKESNEPAQRLAQERRAKPPVGPRRRSGFQADTPLDRARALALRWRALNEVGERELRQRPAAYQPAVGEDATRPPIEPAAKDAKQNKAIQEYMAAHAGTDYKTAALAVARTRRDLF